MRVVMAVNGSKVPRNGSEMPRAAAVSGSVRQWQKYYLLLRAERNCRSLKGSSP